MSDSLGKKLKALRSARMSQDEMAALSGIPRTTIQRIEKGESHDVRDIEAIAKVLEISPAELWIDPKSAREKALRTIAFPDLETKPLSKLSAGAIQGDLSAKDCALILLEFEKVSPGRRAIALAWLFDDEDLLPDDSAPELAVFLHETEKSS